MGRAVHRGTVAAVQTLLLQLLLALAILGAQSARAETFGPFSSGVREYTGSKSLSNDLVVEALSGGTRASIDGVQCSQRLFINGRIEGADLEVSNSRFDLGLYFNDDVRQPATVTFRNCRFKSWSDNPVAYRGVHLRFEGCMFTQAPSTIPGEFRDGTNLTVVGSTTKGMLFTGAANFDSIDVRNNDFTFGSESVTRYGMKFTQTLTLDRTLTWAGNGMTASAVSAEMYQLRLAAVVVPNMNVFNNSNNIASASAGTGIVRSSGSITNVQPLYIASNKEAASGNSKMFFLASLPNTVLVMVDNKAAQALLGGSSWNPTSAYVRCNGQKGATLVAASYDGVLNAAKTTVAKCGECSTTHDCNGAATVRAVTPGPAEPAGTMRNRLACECECGGVWLDAFKPDQECTANTTVNTSTRAVTLTRSIGDSSSSASVALSATTSGVLSSSITVLATRSESAVATGTATLPATATTTPPATATATHVATLSRTMPATTSRTDARTVTVTVAVRASRTATSSPSHVLAAATATLPQTRTVSNVAGSRTLTSAATLSTSKTATPTRTSTRTTSFSGNELPAATRSTSGTASFAGPRTTTRTLRAAAVTTTVTLWATATLSATRTPSSAQTATVSLAAVLQSRTASPTRSPTQPAQLLASRTTTLGTALGRSATPTDAPRLPVRTASRTAVPTGTRSLVDLASSPTPTIPEADASTPTASHTVPPPTVQIAGTSFVWLSTANVSTTTRLATLEDLRGGRFGVRLRVEQRGDAFAVAALAASSCFDEAAGVRLVAAGAPIAGAVRCNTSAPASLARVDSDDPRNADARIARALGSATDPCGQWAARQPTSTAFDLVLRVAPECLVNGSIATFTRVRVARTPPEPLPSVETATQVSDAQVIAAGAVGSPTAALAMQRIAVIGSECHEDQELAELSVMDSPTRAAVGTSALRFLMGAVVFNPIVVVAASVLLVGLAAVQRAVVSRRGTSRRALDDALLSDDVEHPLRASTLADGLVAVRAMHFIFLVFAVTIQPTLGAALTVSALAQTEGIRFVAIAVIVGYVAVTAGGGLLLFRWYFLAEYEVDEDFAARVLEKPDGDDSGDMSKAATAVRARAQRMQSPGCSGCLWRAAYRSVGAFKWLALPRGTWLHVPLDEHLDDYRGPRVRVLESFLRSVHCFPTLFDSWFTDFVARRHWFTFVELAMSALMGLCSSLAQLISCGWVSIVLLLVTTLYLIVLALSRPHSALLDSIFTWVFAVLQVLGSIVQVARAYGGHNAPVVRDYRRGMSALVWLMTAVAMARTVYELLKLLLRMLQPQTMRDRDRSGRPRTQRSFAPLLDAQRVGLMAEMQQAADEAPLASAADDDALLGWPSDNDDDAADESGNTTLDDAFIDDLIGDGTAAAAAVADGERSAAIDLAFLDDMTDCYAGRRRWAPRWEQRCRPHAQARRRVCIGG